MRFSPLAVFVYSAALTAQQPQPATVTIAVLSLFHPQTLTLATPRPARLLLDANATILPANTPLTLRRVGAGLTTQLPQATPGSATRLTLPSTTFTLGVPGKLTRAYTGSLSITSTPSGLRAIVTMPVEATVAAILAAELPADAAPEALKAQAIVARSYLLATPHRHRDFIACDTTHCQFLRAVPPRDSAAARATAATAGLVLQWQSHIVAAMYARSCGGSTRALNPAPPGAYPFFAVRCRYCQRHPELWSRPRPQVPPSSERARIAYNRSHGWAAIPSTSFTKNGTWLEGRGTGHGLGLCQLGAEDLARRGQTFSAILEHYFPAAQIARLP